MRRNNRFRFSPAMSFILLFGIVSLLSDMTHEGAASIQGSYLSLIGASATAIGFISGFGELLGYSLRFVFGKIADKSKKYWPLTIIGYLIDILSVPLLGLVGRNGWILACVLLSIQRIGKSIKKPAKDTIMSFAANKRNAGKIFGISEVLDQIGAFLGPVFLYLIMLFQTNGDTFITYSICFLFLSIPATLTIILLIFTKKKYPVPENFEQEKEITDTKFKLTPCFILYIIGISLFAFGFIDYSLISMHISNTYFSETSFINETTLPLIYSFAMMIDAIAAIIFGKLYDKFNMISLIIATLLASFFPLLIFGFHSYVSLFIGVIMWGIGMGAEESILKAVVSTMVNKSNRATGFGTFELFFGVFWFVGSTLMGYLYDKNINLMIILSISASLLSIVFYLFTFLRLKKEKNNCDKSQ